MRNNILLAILILILSVSCADYLPDLHVIGPYGEPAEGGCLLWGEIENRGMKAVDDVRFYIEVYDKADKLIFKDVRYIGLLLNGDQRHWKVFVPGLEWGSDVRFMGWFTW